MQKEGGTKGTWGSRGRPRRSRRVSAAARVREEKGQRWSSKAWRGSRQGWRNSNCTPEMPVRKEKLQLRGVGTRQPGLPSHHPRCSAALLWPRSENRPGLLLVLPGRFLTRVSSPVWFPARLCVAGGLSRGRCCSSTRQQTLPGGGFTTGRNCQSRGGTVAGTGCDTWELFVPPANSDVSHCVLYGGSWLGSHAVHQLIRCLPGEFAQTRCAQQ